MRIYTLFRPFCRFFNSDWDNIAPYTQAADDSEQGGKFCRLSSTSCAKGSEIMLSLYIQLSLSLSLSIFTYLHISPL